MTEPAEHWWRGWVSTFRLLYRGGPLLDAPDVTRLCVIVGSMSLFGAFCPLFVAIITALMLYVVAAVCWAAHKRTRLVNWLNDWAAKND